MSFRKKNNVYNERRLVFMSKIVGIITITTGVLGTIFGLISLVDQIKNGDKRAKISGEATGEAIVKNLKQQSLVVE